MRKIFLIAGAIFVLAVILVSAALVLILATTPYGPVATPTPVPGPTPTPEPSEAPTDTPTATPEPATPTPTQVVPTMVLYNKVFDVPVGHYSYLYDNRTMNSFAAGNLVTITLNADNPVTFLILNESNYQVFVPAMENRNPTPNWDYYCFRPKITNETIQFVVPKTDSYYFVIDNSGALTPNFAPTNSSNVRVMVTASR